MATAQELSDFLVSIERRAYKHALYTVREEQAALDIVQEAMLKLAERYGDKPAPELPLLFHRILQNSLLDHFRRQKVRHARETLLSTFTSSDSEEEFDILEVTPVQDSPGQVQQPDASLQQDQLLAIIESSLAKLPLRQREAFLLRYWEGLDTAETAAAMGCSEGSVKTHCSRATHTLAALLKAKGIDWSWHSN
ncbi:MAG: RNA polymerase sigma factor [Sideroxydans sp.]